MLLVSLMQVGVQKRRLDERQKQGQARQDGTGGAHRTFAYSTSPGLKSQGRGTSGRCAVTDGQNSWSD